jgi:hypothetical protein
MYLREAPVDWGCSGRSWGSIFFVPTLLFSPSLGKTIFVVLLSFKSRYVDTLALATRIRKQKCAIDRIFQQHKISVEHL